MGRMVLYAVGDIHGCANLLLKLREKISADAAKRSGPKKLIFLGDYVDRGPQSADVIDILMNGQPEGIDEQVCLRGNHEQMMLDWHGKRDWLGSWLLNGGGQTRRSYGKDKTRLGRHLKWLDGLPCFHQDGGHVFVHAGIVPGRPLAQQRNIDLIWIREAFLLDQSDHGFVVVHGHTPVRHGPDIHHNRINVDTGAVYGGPLSCVVLDGGKPGVLRVR